MLVVTLMVFLLTLKIFRMGYGSFRQIFEERLHEWVEDNDYLIDSQKKTAGSIETKEFYFMLTKPHHSNLLERSKLASEFPDTGGRINPKGAFLYTDPNDKQEMVFGLNRSFFLDKSGADLPGGYDLPKIADKLVDNLKADFGDELNLSFSVNGDGTRISVSLKDSPRTNEAARRLVDMVDSVKSMILGLA